MKKFITLGLLGSTLLLFSACSLGENADNTNNGPDTQEGPSAKGPDALPDLRGPLKPPSE